MAESAPRLTIGIPVYNGAQFIDSAIDSILDQTYENFRLLISDNASTDGTEAICRAYVEKDERVRYFRNDTNIGAVRNYNRLFEISQTEYFKWAAHDDVLAPTYLERCIEVLDGRPSVVVCHTETVGIDETGARSEMHDDRLHLCSVKPHTRYREYMFRPYHRCNAIFGVMRASELCRTPLFGCYAFCDRVLLGELALRGEIHRVCEPLFFRRDHPNQGWRLSTTRSLREAWFDPARKGKITFPSWRLLIEHFKAISRVPMGLPERMLCLRQLMKWIRQNDGALVRNLILMD